MLVNFDSLRFNDKVKYIKKIIDDKLDHQGSKIFLGIIKIDERNNDTVIDCNVYNKPTKAVIGLKLTLWIDGKLIKMEQI